MHMPNLERRVQILLDEPRYRRVAGEARRRHVSVATVVRDAIDQMAAGEDTRKDAIARVLAAESMPVPPDPAELRAELDARHERLG
jgi:hypothetical protein